MDIPNWTQWIEMDREDRKWTKLEKICKNG
jgi:hypothetical protein